MYAISSKEVDQNYGCVWDCLLNACWHTPELMDLIKQYENKKINKIQVVNTLINHFFSDSSIRLVAMWGFHDTPARDEICTDLEKKLNELKPVLEKYLN